MTYVNGNVYAGPTASAPLDAWAHDGCLPGDQFEVTAFPAGPWSFSGTAHRQQRWPWHWYPIYGAANPCAYCGGPTEYLGTDNRWHVLPGGPAVRTLARPVKGNRQTGGGKRP